MQKLRVWVVLEREPVNLRLATDILGCVDKYVCLCPPHPIRKFWKRDEAIRCAKQLVIPERVLLVASGRRVASVLSKVLNKPYPQRYCEIVDGFTRIPNVLHKHKPELIAELNERFVEYQATWAGLLGF